MLPHELLRIKTVRVEMAEGIADALLALGYAVQLRPGPLDLRHIVADANTYRRLKPALDGLIVDDERWDSDYNVHQKFAIESELPVTTEK
jgi:hypothetical protein